MNPTEYLTLLQDIMFRAKCKAMYWERKLEIMRQELDEYERDRLLPRFTD